MALNDEIRVDASISKRSQTTGNLLIVMPKLNVANCVTTKKELTLKIDKEDKKSLGKYVDIRNIVIDDSEVPPLI